MDFVYQYTVSTKGKNIFVKLTIGQPILVSYLTIKLASDCETGP